MASNQRRIFIITGMSGAGKSQALKIFGDFGFYCVDNLPLALFKNFTDYLKQSGERRDVALGIDVREGDRLREMPKILNSMVKDDFVVKVIFLDASEECLIRRFRKPSTATRFTKNWPSPSRTNAR